MPTGIARQRRWTKPRSCWESPEDRRRLATGNVIVRRGCGHDTSRAGLTTLRRQPPDRVPVDLGGSLASTLNVHTYRRLMARLGFGDDPAVAFLSRRSNSVLPDERLLARLDVDCRAVILGNPDVNPERELPDGSLLDEWRTTWKHVGEGQHFINTGGPFVGKERRRPW